MGISKCQGRILTSSSILENTISINCFCIPSCYVAIRRHVSLFTALKSQVASLLRNLGARLSRSSPSGSPRFLGRRAGGASSIEDQNLKHDPEAGEVVVLRDLPKVSKGLHQMRTARAFIWGSKVHNITSMDDDDEQTLTDWWPRSQHFQGDGGAHPGPTRNSGPLAASRTQL
jgi:hypothetical protein